jgi:hypothetical protein
LAGPLLQGRRRLLLLLLWWWLLLAAVVDGMATVLGPASAWVLV